MSNIAIITARGGSKRIPKKNIKEFCGKPIIAYSIQAAQDSGLYDEVMVSTDSDEIKKVAMQYGAYVPFLRSKETSNDYATTSDVLLEVLNCYAKAQKKYDILTCIYPTAPFITGNKLKDALDLLIQLDADSLKAVVKFGFPPQRALLIRNKRLVYQFPENEKKRSQDLEPLYHDCGQFYICKVEAFQKYRSLTMPNTIPYIVPEEEVQDIDNESDWAIAEAKYKVLHSL